MLAVPASPVSEQTRSEDDESVVTYDSSATAISSHYLSVPAEKPVRPSRPVISRYVSNAHFRVPLCNAGCQPDACNPSRKPQPSPPPQVSVEQHTLPRKSSASSALHERQSSSLTTITDAHLGVFPMPIPRNPNGALRTVPKCIASDLEELGLPRHDDGPMEAAWEDASCIDGSSPGMDYTERFAGFPGSFEKEHRLGQHARPRMEDRFEVDALRRQVEQLQMALQLQSQQRELDRIALVESQLLRRGLSSLQQARLPSHHQDDFLARSASCTNPTALRATLLNPAHSAAAASLLHDFPPHEHPTLPEFASKQPYYERQLPSNPTTELADRRQSQFSQQSSSPSLSASQTLIEDRKIDDLNRKVQALELMIASMNTNTTPHANADPFPTTAPTVIATPARGEIAIRPASSAGSSRLSDSQSAFQYNPTRPRLSSSASTLTSSTNSATATTAPKKGTGGKLAAALGFGKGASSSTLDASTTGLGRSEDSRVSWSRKRTEKVAVPKAKVRQGPGRGRVVIRDSPAK